MSARAPDSLDRPLDSGELVRVLLVEDNQSLVANVFAYLEGAGLSLDAAPDGVSGLQLAQDNDYDVVVLDWMLPRMEGVEVLRRLRASHTDVPVLMLTARDELDSKLEGFRSGADDYLSKPFAIAELEARIRALALRRRGRTRVLRVGPLRYDLATQEIVRGERALQLHTGCRAILEVLMRESPNIVAKERLEAAIWGDRRPDRDLLRTHIYELRRRLDAHAEPKLLHTVKNVGYRLADT
ncbi:DNA-binding response regulator, OmpR family, contains REC and winged-helix (wHTH) domain [Lysobacter enzymogenes]|jgi:DNA-binding response OmpR family regulator|uniref:Response regulator n=1 Tax=Lysobacter enzymogenes TaxID=69 RepID=A0AAU9AUJ1_LYSEN|nr:response regulator [Lysobacter enzymogenes]SDX70450.1 DNA-binding response regulator, OmpR family, contains REC and winged-helix (wHTH) domain [Lysobacter enzymogenes]